MHKLHKYPNTLSPAPWCEPADDDATDEGGWLESSCQFGGAPVRQTSAWAEAEAGDDDQGRLEALFPAMVLVWDRDTGLITPTLNYARLDTASVLVTVGGTGQHRLSALPHETFGPDEVACGKKVGLSFVDVGSVRGDLLVPNTRIERRGVGTWQRYATCHVGSVTLVAQPGGVRVTSPATPAECAGLWVRMHPGAALSSVAALLNGHDHGHGHDAPHAPPPPPPERGTRVELFAVTTDHSDGVRAEWVRGDGNRYHVDFSKEPGGHRVSALFDPDLRCVVVVAEKSPLEYPHVAYTFCVDWRTRQHRPLSTTERVTVIETHRLSSPVGSTNGIPHGCSSTSGPTLPLQAAVLRWKTRPPTEEDLKGSAVFEKASELQRPLAVGPPPKPKPDPKQATAPPEVWPPPPGWPCCAPAPPLYHPPRKRVSKPHPGEQAKPAPPPIAPPPKAAAPAVSSDPGAVFERIATALERLLAEGPLAKRQRQ